MGPVYAGNTVTGEEMVNAHNREDYYYHHQYYAIRIKCTDHIPYDIPMTVKPLNCISADHSERSHVRSTLETSAVGLSV